MTPSKPDPLYRLDETEALRAVVEGTAADIGIPFFESLAGNLSRALGTRGAWVTEYMAESRRLRALAFLWDGRWFQDYEYSLAGTPCEVVITERRLVHIPENVVQLFPVDTDLDALGAASYLGTPLVDVDGTLLGNVGVMDDAPLPYDERLMALFQIFAARAAAELRRLRAESQVREREEKLGRLVAGTMDAIVELDAHLRVTQMNPAAEKVFHCAAGEAAGRAFERFLPPETHRRFAALAAGLAGRPEGERFMWIPDGLKVRPAAGSDFLAEGSFSCSGRDRACFYTLVLRNVDDRIQAERTIRRLTAEAEYLREEIQALTLGGDIIGESAALTHVLNDVGQVAGTDATVLVLGETGTGKELVARAIHHASRRRHRPFIAVNCAAIPAALIESEFFGHEKGAFTGATARREGRFALANGGSIFLDEIGELPLELQGKLLRVLQEGEFEPVGSSQTRKVDVRVIAATNRDLKLAARNGTFREDLYYRLNVFPIKLPPLRDRGNDVGLLADAFTRKFAARMGRRVEPLSADDLLRLKAYDWPGNVRELQNVIERAVITARGTRLNLDRALPEEAGPPESSPVPGSAPPTVRTAREMEQLERSNLTSALEVCSWRVSGAGGAAELLGMNPSTLRSRMKALGIRRSAT